MLYWYSKWQLLGWMFPLKSRRWIVCTPYPSGIIDTPRATSCDVGSGRVTTVLWSTEVPPDLPWNHNMCGTPNGEWWRFVEKIVMFISCISCMRRKRQKQSTRWVVIGVELHCLHSLFTNDFAGAGFPTALGRPLATCQLWGAGQQRDFAKHWNQILSFFLRLKGEGLHDATDTNSKTTSMVQVMSGMQCYQFKTPTLEANQSPSHCTLLGPRLQMLPSQHPYATCCPTFIVAEDLGRTDCHGTGAMTDRKWYTKLLLLHSKAPNLC